MKIKYITIPLLVCSLSSVVFADLRQYPSNPVVNAECKKNVLILGSISEDIVKNAKFVKSLVDSHKWVGGENRDQFISFLQKTITDYKSNSDFIFNNNKVKIVNDYLKQDCLNLTEEKINEAKPILDDMKKIVNALLLTIANTQNIMDKNGCNVEEECIKQLNEDLNNRINPPPVVSPNETKPSANEAPIVKKKPSKKPLQKITKVKVETTKVCE